jgi:hypothetical protein
MSFSTPFLCHQVQNQSGAELSKSDFAFQKDNDVHECLLLLFFQEKPSRTSFMSLLPLFSLRYESQSLRERIHAHWSLTLPKVSTNQVMVAVARFAQKFRVLSLCFALFGFLKTTEAEAYDLCRYSFLQHQYQKLVLASIWKLESGCVRNKQRMLVCVAVWSLESTMKKRQWCVAKLLSGYMEPERARITA